MNTRLYVLAAFAGLSAAALAQTMNSAPQNAPHALMPVPEAATARRAQTVAPPQ